MIIWGSAPYYDVVLQVVIFATPSRTCSHVLKYYDIMFVPTMLMVAFLHNRSGKILIFGWTMSCKWGVATFPTTNGTIRRSIAE
eukprot:6196643-Pleurochrysis_carterae.AAC.1